MIFDKYCVEQILKGNKTVTRRLYKGIDKRGKAIIRERRPAVPGSIHKLKIDRTQKTYGKIRIISCTKEAIVHGLSDMNEVLKEGFKNRNEYINYFKKVNNIKFINCWVYRVEFELIEEK